MVELNEEIIDNIKKVLNKPKEKENYCVEEYNNVMFDSELYNLVFDKDCTIGSMLEGDGVFVKKKFVQGIIIDLNDELYVLLKGTNKLKEHFNNILYWAED